MAEGVKSEEGKGPEDVSDLWPAKFQKEKLTRTEKKERDTYIESKKKELRDVLIEMRERYAETHKPADLVAQRVAKNRYINFVFLALGADAAEKVRVDIDKTVGGEIKERRFRRLGTLREWLDKNSLKITAALLVATFVAAPFAYGLAAGLSVLLKVVGVSVLSWAFFETISVGALLSYWPFTGDRKKIKDFETAEAASRAKGETYEQFKAANPVLVYDYQKTRERQKKWDSRARHTVRIGLGIAVGAIIGPMLGMGNLSMDTILEFFH